MRSLRRVGNLVEYEWKRIWAKKKFILLVVLALLLQGSTLYPFYRAVKGTPEEQEVKAFMWLPGLLRPEGVLIPLIASIIACSAMAEEYERGRADILLTKPITRREYLAGKYLGGLLMLSVVMALMTILSVGLSWKFFGPQEHLQYVPIMYVALIYGVLHMFSLTFTLSEVVRSSLATIIIGIVLFLASMMFEVPLVDLYYKTGEELYLTARKLLPSWSTQIFPTCIAYELMDPPRCPGVLMVMEKVADPFSAVIIAGYTIPSIVVAYFRFRRSDIAHKVGG